MADTLIITVQRLTKAADQDFQLLTFWDQINPTNPADVTGWLIKLIVKPFRFFVDRSAVRTSEVTDAEAYFDLAADVTVAPTNGEYTFHFTTIHTCLPAGTYPGQIRWWTAGVQVDSPDNGFPVSYVVTDSIPIFS